MEYSFDDIKSDVIDFLIVNFDDIIDHLSLHYGDQIQKGSFYKGMYKIKFNQHVHTMLTEAILNLCYYGPSSSRLNGEQRILLKENPDFIKLTKEIINDLSV